MEEIKTLIEKYKAENAEIIKKRPDLQFNNDFSLEGCKLDANVTFIKDLSVLAKRLNENGGLHKHIVMPSRLKYIDWAIPKNNAGITKDTLKEYGIYAENIVTIETLANKKQFRIFYWA